MIYFENASKGTEGFNTHVMSYTFCVSFSKFLGLPFYLDFEIPSSTPPAYALKPDLKDRFSILMDSDRSLVSDLLDMPADRVFEIDRHSANKAEFQLLYSYFATTDEMRERFENTMMWDFFGFGRFPMIREQLQGVDLIEWTHTKLANPSTFYFLPRKEKEELLAACAIRYIEPLEDLAATLIEQLGRFNAVHLRLGDFRTNYASDEFSVDGPRFCEFVRANLADPDLPVLIATDGLDEKEVFEEIFAGAKVTFIDELVFDDFRARYAGLPFTDFNALTVLNQLICAAADTFIGTYRSTFTTIIHRLRQERYGKVDFHFFPDGRVARLLNDEMKIAPDRSGFFDWNRYSVFAEDHSSMAWMREWDHKKTSLDV
jgi:hypothetical protein